MVEQVSSFNAKTHMSKLLAQVERGVEFVITRHNHAVAKLVPIHSDTSIHNVIDDLKRRRRIFTLEENSICTLKSEGRK